MHDVNVDTTVAFPTLVELVRVLLAVELTPIERDFYSFNIAIDLIRYSVILDNEIKKTHSPPFAPSMRERNS